MENLMGEGIELALAAMFFWGTEVEKDYQLKNWITHLHKQIEHEYRTLISIKVIFTAELPSKKFFLLDFSNGTTAYLD